ncbi:hypothetical protein MRB53_031865 [Persea americana]|uniref:Uncharacterized protein n=1 Tax=Persea americana TaxID=3435 RepID=A0ACC2KQ80_PERAE|nr:hypothetical protein MRB53_031865 [Persea americana]|eukprot:TRINITY_DN12059_c0_g1_i2.p1 TRINITY_DN12059_c0_g1~~TRINITY_DN12059_c0_g1_i2.p1  ORF type:complete len:1307 (+),score=306.85 TRINITY_DN12059_c0_g1_i2:69-3989(+)
MFEIRSKDGSDFNQIQPQKMFKGIRFVLIGFDSVSEAQYRSELVNGGGVDVGRYDESCTHVIVHGRVYDDPVCIAARRDGKTLVTEFWVEDSLDIVNVADARRILYRPVKDLKGIPGAESLHICLTGYQRQDRDGIMRMVELMGAQFSKPLVASKVTHLICYKFEGEKYELAKKIGKNLVNHLWLEDCLKTWEILPVDNYSKSSWELELMEAQARDSEEETEPDGEGLSNLHGGSGTLIPSSELPTPVREVPKIQQDKTADKGSSLISEDISMRSNRLLSTPSKETNPEKASELGDFDDKGLEEYRYMSAGSHAREDNGSAASSSRNPQNASFPGCRSVELNKEETTSSSSLRTTKRSPYSEASIEKSSDLSYSRKIPRKSESLLTELSNHQGNKIPRKSMPLLTELSNHQGNSPQVLGEKAAVDVRNSSGLTSKQAESDLNAAEIQIQTASAVQHHDEEQCDFLPQKRKATTLNTALSSPNKGNSAITTHGSSEVDPTTMIDAPSSNADPSLNNNDLVDMVITVNQLVNQPVEPSKSRSASIMEKSGKRMRPASRIKESKKNCSLLNSNVTGLPCDVEPSHTLDKQTTKSDAIPYEGTSAAETDMNQDAAAISGRSAAESFMKEQVPQLPLGIKAKNEDVNLSRPPNCPVSESGVHQKLAQHEEVLSHNRKVVDAKKSQNAAHSSSLTGRNPMGKVSKKLVAKRNKTFSPKLSNTSKGYGATKVDKTITPHELEESEDGAELVKAVSDNNAEMPIELHTKASDVAMEGGTHSVKETKVESKAMNKEVFMDAEKEKETDMAGFNYAVSDLVTEEGTHRSMNRTESKNSGMNRKEALMDVETEKRPVMDKSISIAADAFIKERVSFVTKMREASAVDEIDTSMDLDKVKHPSGAESASNTSGVVTKKLKGMRRPVNKTMSKISTVDNKEKFMDAADKENRPSERPSVNSNKQGNQKDPVQSIKKSTRNEVVDGTDAGGLHASGVSSVLSEPAWFILSGHRLQRKEFQQVIRRLRGRLCRDSHQWSYQATHFIVPDPVRRTEKFFAAAAAGRWILKTEYLTASNQAERFLAEEPFEWYKKGLSDDGAISLEAPRKWRLVRERTGHGAFYGMRILIYGECVAPSLDTLKRVVKAGDGTILATSPPYNRFLKSGVDFAIIGQGVLRVDCWVQEFLRHETPCIVADYLVDYVCKPGSSLERHVLYKTHPWAEKSFANLLSRSEEVVQNLTTLEQNEDIACEVCGSHERGDVMLICGDEGGSLGCGKGTHIDCCDPPLEAVPEEDWFCSKCRSSTTASTKRQKKASSSKKCK